MPQKARALPRLFPDFFKPYDNPALYSPLSLWYDSVLEWSIFRIHSLQCRLQCSDRGIAQ